MTDEVTYYEIGGVEEVPEGDRIFIEVDGKPIVVFNVGGVLYAIGDMCTHDGGPLGDGEVEGHEVVCPRHGARFDIRNGKALTAPAFIDTLMYPVRVVDGRIEIGL